MPDDIQMASHSFLDAEVTESLASAVQPAINPSIPRVSVGAPRSGVSAPSHRLSSPRWRTVVAAPLPPHQRLQPTSTGPVSVYGSVIVIRSPDLTVSSWSFPEGQRMSIVALVAEPRLNTWVVLFWLWNPCIERTT